MPSFSWLIQFLGWVNDSEIFLICHLLTLLNFVQAVQLSFCLAAIESRRQRDFSRKWKIVDIVFSSSITFLRKNKEKYDKHYRDSASISMMKKWFTEFSCVRTSTSESERCKPIERFHDIVLADREWEVHGIV